jgi:hypothetical protein
MKKPLLAMFVVAAIAIGLLIVLAIGLLNVDEDGREQNGGGRPGAAGVSAAGYPVA